MQTLSVIVFFSFKEVVYVVGTVSHSALRDNLLDKYYSDMGGYSVNTMHLPADFDMCLLNLPLLTEDQFYDKYCINDEQNL